MGGGVAFKWNKSRTGANLEGRPKASCDGVEAAERFGAKIFEISRVDARLRRFFFCVRHGGPEGAAPPPTSWGPPPPP